MLGLRRNRYSPPVEWSGHILSAYSLGRKWRNFGLGLLVVAIIVLCEVWIISGDSSSQGTDHDVSLTRNPPKQPVVGKVTISFGEPDAVYERAIRSHEYHNLKMGYPQFLLKERLLSGLWSKHAYIFSVLVGEMSKPEGQRLEWLM